MTLSMGDEIENLTQLLSTSSRDLIELTIKHRELQYKFDAYY